MAKVKTLVLDTDKLNAIDHTKVESIGAFLKDIGSQMTGRSVWANLTHGLYQHGAFHRTANSPDPIDVAPLFEAYHDGRKLPGGPGALATDSIPTYRWIIASVVNAGRSLPYTGETVMAYIETLGSIGFGSRAGIINRIVADFPTDKPTFDALVAKYADNTPDNVTDKINAGLAALERWGTDESPDTLATLVSNDELKAAYKAARDAYRTLAKISAVVLTASPKRAGKAKAAPSAAATTLA